MRIAFLGNFTVPYCSEVHHTRTLEAMGHTVVRLQETRETGESILRKALLSDLFIWVHTHGWETPGKPMAEVLAELKRNNIPTASYHLDLYMGLERWKEYEGSDCFKLDYFFTVDPKMADWLNENTDTKGVFVPAGVFDEECYLLDVDLKEKDIIFVGSRGYHPEWPWRAKLIDWLKETYGDRFEHWGGDGKGVVRGEDLNRLYATTKVVIGDTLCPGFCYPEYFSDRLFETTGRGGFLLFPYIENIEKYFKIKTELVTFEFNNFEDLKTKIDYYLDHDDIREAIREAGHERTKRDHTYKNRWAQILEVING